METQIVPINTHKTVEDSPTLNKDKFCYNGNTKLMKAGTLLSYTEDQIREIYKCATDIIYFIENYVYIVNLDEGLVKFKLYPYQQKMIKSFQENRFNLCLLSRQMGGMNLPM